MNFHPPRLHRAVALLLLLLGIALPSAARADEVAVLLPLIADVDIAEAQREEALQTLVRALETAGYGLRAVPLGGPSFERCEQARCASAAREAADADVAVHLRLFHASIGGGLGEVVLTLFSDAGTAVGRSGGEGALTDIPAATRAALADAQRRAVETSSGIVLAVTGTPPHAEIDVDGAYVGELPYRGPIDPGSHRVVVRREGYREEARDLSVPTVGGHVERVQVDLVPIGGAGGADPVFVATGAALTALGLAGAVVSIVDLSIAAQPEHAIIDGWALGAWVAVGVVGLGVGIPLFVHGFGQGSGAVRAQVGLGGLSIAGSF